MMLRQLLAICCFGMVLAGPAAAQPYIVQGSIEHSAQGLVYLASYYGDRFTIVDSLETSSGSFLFLLSEEQAPGLYRLFFSDEYQGVRSEMRFVEFIYNHEDVLLNVSVDEMGPFPSFDNSTENRVYFEFVTFQLEYEEQLSEIYGQLSQAKEGEKQYEGLVSRYEDLQLGRKNFLDSLSILYPDLYATGIMDAFRTPVVSGSISHAERIESLKQDFFELAGIEDPALLYAPVYSYRILDYLSLYTVDSLSMGQQEERFIEAIDQLMVHVSSQPELRSFALEFLLEGFELLGMEQVQLHLLENYLDESCESDLAELVRTRMEGYKKMLVGARAPDFSVMDVNGENITLSDLPNPYTLLMFWSSTCGHCREMMPEMKQWYMEENQIELEVVAVSIDSSALLFENYMEEEKMPWITIHERLGWQGDLAAQYFIYATPTLFLLNKEGTILARPATFRQFQRSIKKLQ